MMKTLSFRGVSLTMRSKRGGVLMSVVAGLGTAAGAEMLAGARPARGRTSPKTKRALVVAVSLLTLSALVAALIPASEAPNYAEHSSYYYSSSSSAGTTADRSGAAGAPVSQAAAPQMSEKDAHDAYAKLPLSFVPNEGQTNEAVRYYAQGAGYGLFFTQGGATLSFADGEGRGHRLALDFLGANPNATLEAQERLSGRSTTWWGTTRPSGARGCPPTASSSTAGCGRASTWPCAGRRGASSSTSSTFGPAPRLRTLGLHTAGPRGSR
jgi:hypothetical protein